MSDIKGWQQKDNSSTCSKFSPVALSLLNSYRATQQEQIQPNILLFTHTQLYFLSFFFLEISDARKPHTTHACKTLIIRNIITLQIRKISY